MPQGKMRKTKLPDALRTKKKEKGPPVSRRGNAPATPRNPRNIQVRKLKKLITKTVNATAEEQLRAIAMDGKKFLLSNKKNQKQLKKTK